MADNLYFNGTSLVQWDLHRDVITATRESIRFRFKTVSANGVLMYSRGTQGDFIALQLRDNRMLLNIDLGKFILNSTQNFISRCLSPPPLIIYVLISKY